MADWLIHSFIDRLTDWVIEWLADLRMYELSIDGLLHRLLDCWSIDERLQLNDWRLVSDRFGNAGFIEWRLPSGYARRMWPGWMLIFKLQCSCRCLREVWRHVESCRVNIQGAFRSLSSFVTVVLSMPAQYVATWARLPSGYPRRRRPGWMLIS